MKRIVNALFVISIALIFSAAVAQAETVVLDFEDLTGTYEPIPDGYGGIASWGNDSAYWTTFDIPDENYPPYSGVRRCYTFGQPAPILFGTQYVFDGSWIAGPEGPPDWVVWYELFLEGELVHTSESLAPTPTPTWLASGYDFLVDEVWIWHTFANFYCMDDFTYTTPAVATEESTWSSVKSLYR